MKVYPILQFDAGTNLFMLEGIFSTEENANEALREYRRANPYLQFVKTNREVDAQFAGRATVKVPEGWTIKKED